MMGRSRNEQTPEGAAQTMGIEFTALAAVATHPAVVGSASSNTTSAVNDGVPSMRAVAVGGGPMLAQIACYSLIRQLEVPLW
jgi:hypothetical protein